MLHIVYGWNFLNLNATRLPRFRSLNVSFACARAYAFAMATPLTNHPCLSCGACCNSYRVSFHWNETMPESYGVPIEMTQQISPYQNAMIGTDQKNPACIAYTKSTDNRGSCAIYENRPTCCRTFEASFENGSTNPGCDEARAGKGLNRLTPLDWAEDPKIEMKAAFLPGS